MEVDNERNDDEDAGDEVQNLKDIQMLERLRLGNDNEDNIPPSVVLMSWTMLIVMTRPMIQLISIMKIISNTCNTMFFVFMFCSFLQIFQIHVLLCFCNYVLFIFAPISNYVLFFFFIAGE